MRKNYLVFVAYLIIIGLIIGLTGCTPRNNRSQSGPVQLPIPANLNISVVGRLMTVSWDAVENASGYIIQTTSAGCISGDRIVNTDAKTATNHAGAATNSAIAENGITNRGNGFVTFTGETSFTIWLMSETGSETEVMATSLTATILALGDDVSFADSGRSAAVTLAKANYTNR